MTEDQKLAYAAGLIDGEGYIGIYLCGKQDGRQRRAHQATLGCQMTRIEGISMLQEMFGGRINTVLKPNPRYAPSYVWLVRSRMAADAMRRLLPYLKIKRAQAELALSFQAGVHSPRDRNNPVSEREYSQREQMRQRMKTLNQKGPFQLEVVN